MSHRYHLRPNANRRIERKLDGYVAALGDQDRDRTVARSSATGQGVHLRFDPERSSSPAPSQPAEPPRYASSTEYPIVVEHSDGEDSSGLGSDLVTIIDPEPDTPPRNYGVRASPPRVPGAPRQTRGRQRNGHEGSVAASSGVVDSMASIVNPRKLRYGLGYNEEYQRRMAAVREQVEAELQRLANRPEVEREERLLEGRLSALRREYERTVEQFRQQHPDMFTPHEGSETGSNDNRTPTGSPESMPGNIPPEVSRAPGSEAAGPSLSESQRRDEAAVSPRRQGQSNNVSAADGTLVTVARRVPKLGPCGTLVIDHGTGKQVIETKRYLVRSDALHDIDEDGDSVMGGD